MIIHQYVSKAVQDDAQLAGERNRLLLEARRPPRGAPRARGSRRSDAADGPAAVPPGASLVVHGTS